jgi:hypothetical protein
LDRFFECCRASFAQVAVGIGAETGADGIAVFMNRFEAGAQFAEILGGVCIGSIARSLGQRMDGEERA